MAMWPEVEGGGKTVVDWYKRRKESSFGATEIESPATALYYTNGLNVGGTDAVMDQNME